MQNNTADNNTPKECGKTKRIVRRTILSLIALVVLCLTAAIIWLGDIAEWYIEKYDTELVGRRVEMDDLSIKLFSGKAAVDNITLYEADGVTHFAHVDHMEAELALGELFGGHIHLTRAHLAHPYLRIDQDVEVFNFDDMLSFITETYLTEESKEENEPWIITLDDITISKGHLWYYDHELDKLWELTALELHSPTFHLDDRDSSIDAAMVINDRATLDGALELNYATWDFNFEGMLEEFPIAETYNYWLPYLNVGSLAGVADATFSLEGNVMNIFAMDIRGEATAKGFGITSSTGGNILSADMLTVGIEELNIESGRYILSKLVAEGYASEMELNADGSTNFDPLFYSEPTVIIESTATAEGEDLYDVAERVTLATAEEESLLDNMVLRIGHAELNGGKFRYRDNTMHRTFEYDLRDIKIEGDNIDLMGNNNISLAAKLPKQGSVTLRWDGSLNDFHNQSLMLMLNNVDMVGLSPYVEHFTGFPITDGNLTFRSQNIVNNGSLSGINQFGTYNFAVGKRDKSIDAEIKLPLRLAVFLLTDKDEHIDIDLPVSGNLDSPKFSYGRIIMKAVGGLMLKLVVSPFEFMSGDKQDAYRHIDLDLLEPGLGSEHYARLDKMAEALKNDNSVQVRLTQRVNYKRAAQRLSNLNLKIAYYNHKHGAESGYLDMLAFSRINDVKMSNKDMIKYADSLLVARGIDPSSMNTQGKALALYEDVVEGQMVQLMEHRNRIITEYMSFQHQDIPEGAFTINNVVIKDMKNYFGKDRFTVTLIIDSEEVALPAPEDDTQEEDYYDAYALDDESLDEGTIVAQEDNFSADEALATEDTE